MVLDQVSLILAARVTISLIMHTARFAAARKAESLQQLLGGVMICLALRAVISPLSFELFQIELQLLAVNLDLRLDLWRHHTPKTLLPSSLLLEQRLGATAAQNARIVPLRLLHTYNIWTRKTFFLCFHHLMRRNAVVI